MVLLLTKALKTIEEGEYLIVQLLLPTRMRRSGRLDDRRVKLGMARNRNDVGNTQQEMEVQRREEMFPWIQRNGSLVRAFGINVWNKIRVVGILFDIDSFHTGDAIVFH